MIVRTVRTRLLVIVALLAVGVAVGCSDAGRAPETVAPGPSTTSSSGLDAFVDANGFGALPRGRVLLGGDGAVDALLDVEVVVAATPEAQSRGLMGVTEVPAGVGMLFVFPGSPSSGRPGFWMLDTLVPLDIAFAADGVVVGVATMEPCRAQPCPITHPGVDYDVALEVAAGALGAAVVEAGARFVWEPAG
jgi:uncharacterized membrane protein (UPF0127 family)